MVMAAKRSPLQGPYVVVGIGELLWDVFPDGRRELGGAVANLAYHASLLGDRGALASSVGRDANGDDLVRRLCELGVDGRYLQRDAGHPTGTVDVALHDGAPSYTIHEQVAFDHPRLDPRWRELAARTDAVTFGTLAQRTPGAAAVIGAFVAACPPRCVRLFDVNLRQHFWSAEVLDVSLRAATAVKLNDEELPLVANALGIPAGDDHAMLAALLERYRLQVACLTRGARGCLLAGAGTGPDAGTSGALPADAPRIAEQPGICVPVADTVGAGDAFAAALLYHVLRGADLQRTATAANRYAAFVATRRGATPAVPEPVLHEARAVA
jgi:fructokinase